MGFTVKPKNLMLLNTLVITNPVRTQLYLHVYLVYYLCDSILPIAALRVSYTQIFHFFLPAVKLPRLIIYGHPSLMFKKWEAPQTRSAGHVRGEGEGGRRKGSAECHSATMFPCDDSGQFYTVFRLRGYI